MNSEYIKIEKKNSLSVVIASLGDDHLLKTISQINLGTIVPDEIILCVPRSEFHRVKNLCIGNIRCLQTDFRGQVAQRTIGFLNASSNFVLQLDDDVILESTCVERLLSAMEAFGQKTAVGPSLIDNSNFSSIYKRREFLPFIRNIYFWLLNGSCEIKAGSITKAGVNVGWDPGWAYCEFREVEWMAGGCIMHRKENLVLEDFYPFAGKAYCEDLIHSYILKTRGISLIIDARARCLIDPPNGFNVKLSSFLKDLFLDYRARKFYVKSRSLNLTRMNLYYLLRITKYLYLSLANKVATLSK
jgi:hypothetical protein